MSETIEISRYSAQAERGWILRYGVAPTCVALALAVRALLAPTLHGNSIFLYFMLPVLISAGIGGFGPGALATALSIVVAYFLVAGAPVLSSAFVINAVGFALIGLGMSWGGELLHRSRRRANMLDARRARARSASAIDPRHRAGGDDRHRRTRRHAIVQQRRRTAVRLHAGRSGRAKRQDADAGALPRKSRLLSQSLQEHRRAPHHRHRPRRGRRAQGRLDLPDGAGGRRNEILRPAVFHRLHPRPDRAAANRGATAGTAVRARAYFPAHRHGRDGLDAGART